MPRAVDPSKQWPLWLTAGLALLAIVAAVGHLERAAQGLVISTQRLGPTPVTVFKPAAAAGAAPVVLVAHGFAGSQQLMQPLALTLARNGFVAVTFDFPGHGRNSAPMRGGLADQQASQRTLLATLEQMGAFARGLARASGGNGGYAVVGHSMASDIVVRHAQAHADVQASVGVSLFAPSIQAGTPANSPRNLLVIDGALEPQMMAGEALRVVAQAAGPGAVSATTYGNFEDGSARRAVLSPGVEHIGVLYSAHTLAETLDWLDAAFGRPRAVQPFIDARGPWLGLLLTGVVALAWPLSRLLPCVRTHRPTARASAPAHGPFETRRWWRWRGQAPLTLLPALITPLLLWKMPGNFLPILLGDYLVLHFALYGLLTLAGLRGLGAGPAHLARGDAAWLGLAILFASAYALLAVGAPVDRYVFNVRPEPVRLPLIAALCAGTLVYFLADEWLTRGTAAAPGAYLASKICFLLSLVLAIGLNPQRLFFLAIIVPAVLLMFVIYGLFSRWACRRTGHPAVAAIANALAFGWFIAVTFPLVG
jgi:dienelactone hydrolase